MRQPQGHHFASLSALDSALSWCQSRASCCFSWCKAPCGAGQGTGCSSHAGVTEHPSHRILVHSAQRATGTRFLQTFLPVISEANCIPPITKVMLLESWLEKQHCLWRSQIRQQMGFFSWDLIQKTDKFKTFAPYGSWSISHSSHTHMRNCIKEQGKGNTNTGKKI